MKSENHGAGAVAWRQRAFEREMFRVVACLVMGVVVLTVSAKIQVPFSAVPMTMQSFAVGLLALCLGARLSVAAVLAYLGCGLAGMPVFAGIVAGPAYFAGPTGGYLIGFVAMAGLMGIFADWALGNTRGSVHRFLATLTLMIAGHTALFLFGVSWLALAVDAEAALAAGLVPFLPGTVIKSILMGVVAVTPVFRKIS